ncbi:MAG: PorT family protein [Bacteroides sp.]|nr:PorT family protein [Bacteroides sp.]MBD5291278.1 PorT family protein [Bacteroides sp.]
MFSNDISDSLIRRSGVRRRRALSLLLILLAVLIQGGLAVYAKPGDKILNRPYADLKRWHLGFSIGMSLQDFRFIHNGHDFGNGEQWFAEVPSLSPGINVSVLADLRLHQYFNLRFSPGMSFGSKNVHFFSPTLGETRTQDIKNVYVLLPLDLKISGDRYHNSRPYVTVGAMGAFDVGKKPNDYLKLKTPDAYLTFGLGCDFYLPYFKFIPEIKFCFGLADILQRNRPDLEDDDQTMKITQSLKKVKSNMVMITFYFE